MKEDDSMRIKSEIWRFLPLVCLIIVFGCSERPKDVRQSDQLPAIFPDYVGVTIPVGIAPLNFTMGSEDFDCMDVIVKGAKGGELHANGEEACFDIDEWHELVEQNKGSELTVTVCQLKQGVWTQYKDFSIHVSPYALDEWGVTYRRIAPGYEVYSHMGLYQRDLSSFDEDAIIVNTQAPGMCVNCHTSNRTNPDRFVFHVRGEHGATMIQRDVNREWLQAKNELLGGSMVYPYWHPNGKYCAFSTNQTRQGFHITLDPKQPATNQNRIEVFDLSSDIFVYNVETHETLRDSLVMTPDWSENVPVFSPDGRTLYYMTCLQKEYPMDFREEKYNLCKIDFDPDKGRFGNKVDTLFNAVARGKSLTWPRPSYDGKYLLFTLMDYGYFSIWHEESEQWLLNLETGEARAIDEINSPRADSYHNWNVNSHWVVFTSRRGDGLYSRLYFASVDDQGHFTKPFLLPQRHPRQYEERSVYSFNTPDFTSRKVDFDARQAGHEILSDKRIESK